MTYKSICDMYHIIGLLQGYAMAVETIPEPNLESLAEGLHTCAECLELIAKDLSKECNNVGTDSGVAAIGQ